MHYYLIKTPIKCQYYIPDFKIKFVIEFKYLGTILYIKLNKKNFFYSNIIKNKIIFYFYFIKM